MTIKQQALAALDKMQERVEKAKNDLDWLDQLPQDFVTVAEGSDWPVVGSMYSSLFVYPPLDKHIMGEMKRIFTSDGWEVENAPTANQTFSKTLCGETRFVFLEYKANATGATCKLVKIGERKSDITIPIFDVVCVNLPDEENL